MMRSEQGDADTRYVTVPDVETAPSERRSDVRQVTVRLVAKMAAGQGEELCLVRNISAGGLTAHVYSALTVGAAATFEFASGCVVAGRILWQRDSLAGVQFDERVDTRKILSRTGISEQAPEPRAPRVELGIRARARLGATYRALTLANISQGGAKLRAVGAVEEGQKLVLLVDGLPPLSGRVRWTREDEAGMAFYEPVPFDLLAQWLPIVQHHHLPGPPA